MTRLIIVIVLALAFALPLASCGKKGDPTLPQGKSDDFPRKYPSEQPKRR